MAGLRMVPALCAAGALTACATVRDGPAAAGQAPPVLVGYLPAGAGLDAAAGEPDLAAYTHINIAFANPDPAGAFTAGDTLACMTDGHGANTSLAAFRELVDRGHRAGARVLVSLGGGAVPTCSGDWAALLAPSQRHGLVRRLVRFVRDEGLDGVDVDIEGALLTRIDRAGNFTPFIAELARALRGHGKLLTCATASYDGGMIPIASIRWFDLVNVMAYDQIGPGWGTPGDAHAPMEQAVAAMALWRSRGVGKAQLVLGVPFYGYGFGDLGGSYPYREIARRFGPGLTGDTVGPRCAGCSYITFNDADTLRRKARLGLDQGRGVMVWQIAGDTADGALIRAMRDAMGLAPR